jgi:hypothetical protein
MMSMIKILPGTGRWLAAGQTEGAILPVRRVGATPSTTASRRSPSPYWGGIA